MKDYSKEVGNLTHIIKQAAHDFIQISNIDDNFLLNIIMASHLNSLFSFMQSSINDPRTIETEIIRIAMLKLSEAARILGDIEYVQR